MQVFTRTCLADDVENAFDLFQCAVRCFHWLKKVIDKKFFSFQINYKDFGFDEHLIRTS